MSGATLGLDIGGTSVKGVLMRDGQVTRRSQSSRYFRPDASGIENALREALVALTAGAPEVALRGCVGLCAPGLIDAETTRVETSMNIPGLVGTRLDELVGRVMNRPIVGVKIASDALAAATDFRAVATPPVEGRLLAISLGTGVGMAIVDDGGTQLLVNPGTSGHIGQIDVSLNEHAPVGPDGGRGSLEAYIGLPALRARYGDRLGPALARVRVTDAPIRALIRAIRVVHAIYRPHCVALLGGVGIAIGDSPAGGLLHERVSDGLTGLARAGWRLEFALDGHHAAAGAARLAAGEADVR